MHPEHAPPPSPKRTPRRPLRIVAILALLGGLLACGTTEEDPADASRRRLRERLEETFSGDQATCVIDELPIGTVEELIGEAEPSDEAVRDHSAALRTCLLEDAPELPEAGD